MAGIRLEDDNNDPYRNYPGGSQSFNESANAAPVATPSEGPVSRPPTDNERKRDIVNYRDWEDGPYPNDHNSVPAAPSPPLTTSANTSDIEQAIRDQYQRIFGRAPQGNELATDLEAARRYGLTNPNGPTGGVLGQIAARGNNSPGSNALGNPFQGWSNPNDPRTAMSQPRGAAPINYPGGSPSFNESGGSGVRYSPQGVDYPGFQFNDPYTNLLEQIAKNQITSLTGQNPQTQQLMDFLNKKFGELSNAQGYTPDELALLRTQAQEPIMAARDAAHQRELERTARAGYLPTSGLTLDQQRQIDTDYGKMSAAAQRDLAISSINRRDQQMAQALQLGKMGMQIPQQQNAQALDVANILYQLPRQAMMDANTIVNGSSPQNVLSPYIQLMQQQQQAQLIAQQQQQAFWEALAYNAAKAFGGGQ